MADPMQRPSDPIPADMQAFVLTAYGAPDRTRMARMPLPRPGPAELLVRVHAAGLNPVDFKTRRGDLRPIQRYALPAVLGNELAGEVVACGAEVQGFRPGDRVFARVGKERMGAFAEFACVAQAHAARMPANLDFASAAALPLAGLTALQVLRDILKVSPGQRIFIAGGAGGVGTLAIQLAKSRGAHVTTTASQRGEALVRGLGADVVIDYTRASPEALGPVFDGAFDAVGGPSLEQAFGLVKPGGQVVSIAGMPEPQTATQDLGRGPGLQLLFWAASLSLRRRAARHGVTYRYYFMHPSGDDLAELARAVEAGALRPVIDTVMPFAQVAQAMARLEAGHAKGKIMVRMDAPGGVGQAACP